MDVTCARCGTEYEFDETLVSSRGTTVKCTNCGHLFKVFRPDEQNTAEPAERAWYVRTSRGTTEKLGSLRELQQRITQGLLNEHDQISRSGESWKPLGEIAELKTFFQAAAAAAAQQQELAAAERTTEHRKQTLFGVGASPSSPPSAAPRQPQAPRPVSQAPAPQAPRSQPPIARAPIPQAPRSVAPAPVPQAPVSHRPPMSQPAPPAPPQPSLPPAPPRPASRAPAPPPARPTPMAPAMPSAPAPRPAKRQTQPAPVSEASAAAATAAAVPRAKAAPPAQPAARQPKPALYLDEEEHRPTAPPGPRRTGTWIAVALLLGLGGAGVYYWQSMASVAGIEEPDPLAAFLAEADAALRLDTEAGYEDALREYTRASAHDEGDERVLLGLAKTHGAMAQAAAFAADDLQAQGGEARAANLREEAREHAQQSKEFAEDALRRHPEASEAHVAIAHADALLGHTADARSALEAFDAQATAYSHWTTGIVAANDGLEAARPHAEAAIASDPDWPRGHLLMARIESGAGNIDGANTHLSAILGSAPEHDYALALRERLSGSPEATSDAGTEAPAETVPAAETAETSPTAAPRNNGGGGGGGGGGNGPPPPGRDYSWYLRRADGHLDRGSAALAQEYYQAAVEVRPAGVEALTGLGYAALSQGRASEAARYFRPAARADYGDAYIGLGEAYRRSGRNAEALQAYRSYLASRPNGPQASIARRHVDTLSAAETPEPPSMAPAPAPTPAAPLTPEPAPAASPDPQPSPEPTLAPAAMEPAPAPSATEPAPAPAAMEPVAAPAAPPAATDPGF